MYRVVNLGFNELTDVHVQTLAKYNLLNNREVLSKKTHLPFIDRNLPPGEIQRVVKQTVLDLNLMSNDIVITSGMPDVCVYIDRYVPIGVIILIPIGVQKSDIFRLYSFREVIRVHNSDTPLHLFPPLETQSDWS